MSVEFEQPVSQFRHDMLEAFRHGIEYEHVGHNDDLAAETADKNLPFAEWFARHYGEKDTAKPATPAKTDGAGAKHWYESEGWEYHAKDCTAYNSEILSCDCGLDAHLAAQPEVDSEGHLELYNAHTQLLIQRDELIADNTRLRAELATVTAERDEDRSVIMAQGKRLIVLREERNDAINAGTALEDALAAEREKCEEARLHSAALDSIRVALDDANFLPSYWEPCKNQSCLSVTEHRVKHILLPRYEVEREKLVAEREHTDEMMHTLEDAAQLLHTQSGHKGPLSECENLFCNPSVLAITAHYATRRKADGDGGEA